jgi:hypothetical protein
MVKTADDNENGEWFMRRVDEELLMWRRDTVSCYYFSTALYRVFILWYEYPTRPLLILMYKGNMRMGIWKRRRDREMY